jgi:crotonobetainyl-CoA:carnitine CoA-transferase CaiB-like acyl-CoA transferase
VLGEHTDAILRERLGYSDERIAGLRSAKAI